MLLLVEFHSFDLLSTKVHVIQLLLWHWPLDFLFDLGHHLSVLGDELARSVSNIGVVHQLHVVDVELRILGQLLPERNLALLQVFQVLQAVSQASQGVLNWLKQLLAILLGHAAFGGRTDLVLGSLLLFEIVVCFFNHHLQLFDCLFVEVLCLVTFGGLMFLHTVLGRHRRLKIELSLLQWGVSSATFKGFGVREAAS